LVDSAIVYLGRHRNVIQSALRSIVLACTKLLGCVSLVLRILVFDLIDDVWNNFTDVKIHAFVHHEVWVSDKDILLLTIFTFLFQCLRDALEVLGSSSQGGTLIRKDNAAGVEVFDSVVLS
jgi:hypothetical protein